jgi:membrane-bound lytic murein transglycosylase A
MLLRLFVFMSLSILFGCQAPLPPLDLTPVEYESLPGWSKDSSLEVRPALQRSCGKILNLKPQFVMMDDQKKKKITAADWQPFCRAIMSSSDLDELTFRNLVKTFLRPYKASINGNSQGLFTGYYEPILRGALTRRGAYQTPLYALPKGRDGNIPRSEIVDGALAGKGLELLWVDDPVDAFFLQIQGSGRVILENGRVIKLGYAGTNNHPYMAIARVLVERGELTKEESTMQSIRVWLRKHPKEAETIMSCNQSYVYFRKLDKEGAIGAQGVALTPERSLAVDKRYISLGTPMWVDLEHPNPARGRLQKIMVAQDIGGAIKGGIRGDYFWGLGPKAGANAGSMKSRGEYYVLLPKK